MMTTPFTQHILMYEPPRGYTIPKFVMYDGTYDPFDHLMHYWQMMTLDIDNDEFLCKVFSTSLQGTTLAWFNQLLPNSIHSFKEMLEVFVAHYLFSVKQKFNISNLQNLKNTESEALCQFMHKFGPVMLQVETYNMDALLQAFKCSIRPRTPFF